MAGMLVGLGLKLGLVIILAYLCALAVRKVGQRRGALRIGSGVLRVVESAALAPNRGLHIVAVGKRAFLVGSTPEQFSVLGEVSDVAEVSRLTEAQESTGTLAGRLRQWLGREPRGGRAASRDPLIERMQAGAESLRGLATHSTPRFDNALQAAIDDAHRR
jgi:flagellar biosynthetic protein FliO